MNFSTISIVWAQLHFEYKYANSGDYNQIPHYVTSELCRHYLPTSYKWDVRIRRVNAIQWIGRYICSQIGCKYGTTSWYLMACRKWKWLSNIMPVKLWILKWRNNMVFDIMLIVNVCSCIAQAFIQIGNHVTHHAIKCIAYFGHGEAS